MYRLVPVLAATALLGGLPAAAPAQYSVKEAAAAPPKELNESIRKLLHERAVQLRDAKDALLCEVWFRKEVPGKATPEQVKNGLTYRELPETTLLGVLKVTETLVDYRKQKIKAGVYTLRLGIQLMDGDHMGTSPYNEFALLSPAAEDKAPDQMDVKELHELSGKATGRKHPGLMLLFPNKTAAEAPAMEAKPKDHVVLSYRVPATAAGQKANLGFSLVVVGVTMAE